MALPTQRIKLSRRPEPIDPGPRDSYLLFGLVLVVVAGGMGFAEASRCGKAVFGLTLSALFLFYLLEQFRQHAPKFVRKFLGISSATFCLASALSLGIYICDTIQTDAALDYRCLSSGNLHYYYCKDALRLQKLQGDPFSLTFDALPLVLLAAFFAFAYYCNSRYLIAVPSPARRDEDEEGK